MSFGDDSAAATDLESALVRASAAADAAEPCVDDAARDAPGARADGHYTVAEVSRLLAVFAVAALCFESTGLLTWARRLEVGPVQRGAVAVLEPASAALGAFGLHRLREGLIAAGARAGEQLGAAARDTEDAWQFEPIADDLDLRVPSLPARVEVPMAQTALLVGDSLIAGSLHATVASRLERDNGLRVVHAFRIATGLARADLFDWNAALPGLVARHRPGYVVASFGANDATDLFDGERRVAFGTLEWRRLYSERVRAAIRAMTATGAHVLWLGLPPMRDATFARRVKAMNRIFAAEAKAATGVDFLDLGMVVSDGSGQFTTFQRGDDDVYRRIRLDDGVHYAPAGSAAIARWVADWVREREVTRSGPRGSAPRRAAEARTSE